MSVRAKRGVVVAVFATLVVVSVAFAANVLADPAPKSFDSRHRVEMTFTKWVTITPGGGIMQGIVGGDVVGKFAGQVLVNQTTDLVAKLGAPAADINVLQAVYEVQAGDQSLRGLVQGGYDISANAARLDGTVLGGRLTGENMNVEFVALPCSQSNAGNQSNAFGGTCFQGTITVTPGPDS